MWDAVQEELRAGSKRNPRMWFVFPQLAALGRSVTARHYGIAAPGKRRPTLRIRAGAAAGGVLWTMLMRWMADSAVEIFGAVDAMKLAVPDPVRCRGPGPPRLRGMAWRSTSKATRPTDDRLAGALIGWRRAEWPKRQETRAMIQLQAGSLRCAVERSRRQHHRLWWATSRCCASRRRPQHDHRAPVSCYALVPFSNRIGHATWLAGTQHPLVRNNGDEPPRHPRGRLAAAVVGAGRGCLFLMLSYEHRADASWPFAFDCSHTLRVKPGALELTLALTNQSPQPAPAGLGWHPFFVKRPGSHIAFHATGRWEMGEDKLPTGRTASAGIDADCAAVDVDHCYDGWDGVVRLRDGRLE